MSTIGRPTSTSVHLIAARRSRVASASVRRVTPVKNKMMMIHARKRCVIVPRANDDGTPGTPPGTEDAGDDSARIDKVSNAEDKIRKAREYAAALAKAKADKDAEKKSADADADASGESSGSDKKPSEEYVPPAKKEVTVSILTRDDGYNPFDEDETVVGFETDEAVYKPSVSTWGVFERPPDISKAYGGGRTIRKEDIEDEAAIAERKARVAKKLAKYREDAGMLSGKDYDAARMDLEEAKDFVKNGFMERALELLEPWAIEKVGPKTEIGGQIIFNYAICLDNLQRRDEALKQYRRCIGNQYGTVSKQADRMVWGMTTASRKMKADLFDYMDAAKLDAYDEYLIKMANEKFAGEINEEEVKELNAQAVATMAVLFGAPALLFAYLTLAN